MSLSPTELQLIAGGGESSAAEPLPAPPGLSDDARAVWDSITMEFPFNEAELKLLAEAVEILDTIAELKAEMQGQPKLVRGSMGQQVLNPLMGHIDTLQKTYSAHLKTLGLAGTENVTGTKANNGRGMPSGMAVADNRTISEKRREAGRRGAAKRWSTAR